jgi:peptidoglycan/LPS O-acetylase OafA/YrhL
LSNRLYILDGLRFLLALQVLFCHYSSVFTEVALGEYVRLSGRLAVLGFFILSGFLMHETALNSVTPVEFAVKRIVRLWPAFIICSFLTFFVCNKMGLNLKISSYIANLTFFPGFLFNDKILDGVYWTLQHEIIFYFHIFLLLLTNKFKNLLFRVMCLWLFLCLVLSMVLGYEFYYGKYYKLFLLIPYGPLFIIGVLLSYLRYNFSYKATVAVLIAVLLSIHNERVHSFQSIVSVQL